jgi:acyl-[acyl-carrier-protein] desaturase
MSQQEEVLRSLDDIVAENLNLMTSVESKKWWPGDFFKQLSLLDITELRERAAGLDDDLLVVLVGNTITEEALPNYSSRLANIFPDETGVSERPWNRFQRNWNAEEKQHGLVLDRYMLLTNRVNLQEMEQTTFNLIRNGFEQNTSLYQGLLYPTFQEPATRISHKNTALAAQKAGDNILATICRKIAGDEHRHATYYLRVSQALFDADPEQAMIEYASLMRSKIVMPAQRMATSTQDFPGLFNAFADVAQRSGIYTANDYVSILKQLNNDLGIAHRSVKGSAAEAQEQVMQLPEKLSRVAARMQKKKHTPYTFSWLKR